MTVVAEPVASTCLEPIMTLRALTAGHRDGRPAWSPDGRWIAFWRDPPDSPHLQHDGVDRARARTRRHGENDRPAAPRRRATHLGSLGGATPHGGARFGPVDTAERSMAGTKPGMGSEIAVVH